LTIAPNVFNNNNNNNGRQKTDASNNNNYYDNNNNNDIIKINHFTFTRKIKLSSVVTPLLLATLLISTTSAISMPQIYGQTIQAKENTLKVITQVVCPEGHTCPSASQFIMEIRNANKPKPSSFDGSSSGVDVRLDDIL